MRLVLLRQGGFRHSAIALRARPSGTNPPFLGHRFARPLPSTAVASLGSPLPRAVASLGLPLPPHCFHGHRFARPRHRSHYPLPTTKYEVRKQKTMETVAREPASPVASRTAACGASSLRTEAPLEHGRCVSVHSGANGAPRWLSARRARHRSTDFGAALSATRPAASRLGR